MPARHADHLRAYARGRRTQGVVAGAGAGSALGTSPWRLASRALSPTRGKAYSETSMQVVLEFFLVLGHL